MNRRAPVAYAALLILTALALSAARFESTPEAAATPAPASPGSAAAVLPDLDGIWSGQWVDTVFTVNGPFQFTATVSGSNFSATGTMDLTGVGLGAAEPFTASGTISGTTLSFSFQFTGASALTSSGNAVVADSGPDNLTGTGTVGAPLNFGNYSVTATISDTSLDGTFTYTAGGAGNLMLTKTTAVDDDSWSAVKARYRDDG